MVLETGQEKEKPSGFEMMLLTASKELRDGDALFVGFHWPMLVTRIARRLHAPNLVCIGEGGIIENGLAPVTPTSPSDLILAQEAIMCCDTVDTLCMLLRAGHTDWAILDAPTVDRYGNINTTCIGDYLSPKVRMPGSGGATEIAAFARLIILSGSASKDRFPERVDYISTPGYLDGYDSRLEAGFKPGTGPQLMICPLGRFTFHPVSKELVLDATYPGGTVKEVVAQFSWPLVVSPDVRELPPPTAEELKVVREEIEGARRRYYRIP